MIRLRERLKEYLFNQAFNLSKRLFKSKKEEEKVSELKQLFSSYENDRLVCELNVSKRMDCFIEGGELLNQMKMERGNELYLRL